MIGWVRIVHCEPLKKKYIYGAVWLALYPPQYPIYHYPPSSLYNSCSFRPTMRGRAPYKPAHPSWIEWDRYTYYQSWAHATTVATIGHHCTCIKLQPETCKSVKLLRRWEPPHSSSDQNWWVYPPPLFYTPPNSRGWCAVRWAILCYRKYFEKQVNCTVVTTAAHKVFFNRDWIILKYYHIFTLTGAILNFVLVYFCLRLKYLFFLCHIRTRDHFYL